MNGSFRRRTGLLDAVENVHSCYHCLRCRNGEDEVPEGVRTTNWTRCGRSAAIRTCGNTTAGSKYGAQLFTINGVGTPVEGKAASFDAMLPTGDYAQPAYANWMILSKNAVTGAPERVVRWGTSLIKKRKNLRLVNNIWTAEFMFNLPGDYAFDYLGAVTLNGTYYLAVQAVDRVTVGLRKGTLDSGAYTLGNVTSSWTVPVDMKPLPDAPLSVPAQTLDPTRITAKYGQALLRSVAMKLYDTTTDEDTQVDVCRR